MCFQDMFRGTLQLSYFQHWVDHLRLSKNFMKQQGNTGKHIISSKTIWQGKKRRTGIFIPSKGCPKPNRITMWLAVSVHGLDPKCYDKYFRIWRLKYCKQQTTLWIWLTMSFWGHHFAGGGGKNNADLANISQPRAFCKEFCISTNFCGLSGRGGFLHFEHTTFVVSPGRRRDLAGNGGNSFFYLVIPTSDRGAFGS